MSDANKPYQPLLTVLIVTLVLLVGSLINTQLNVFGFKSKKVDLLSDVRYVYHQDTSRTPDPVYIPKKINAIDTIDFTTPLIDVSQIFDFEDDTTSSLSRFFQALNATKNKEHKTRIAYFGDSMIEGDLISQDLRSNLQELLGGSGVGFVPITSIVAGFRGSIRHSFEGWTTYHLAQKRPEGHELGISGYSFVPDTIFGSDTSQTFQGSWVNYAAVRRKHLNVFHETKLLYGKSVGENYVEINGKFYMLDGDKAVNQLRVKTKNNCKSITAKFYCKTPIDIFGFSMESEEGVFVDNFSFRGSSGMPITKVSKKVYSGTNDYFGYDLIILEYGLNAVSPDISNYSWYEHGMNRVIRHMKRSFPDASILLISVGDKSYRNDGVYETDPSVPILVEAQKRMAKKNKVAFWSLYDAMGGYGSMIQWVEGDTALANKDYAHFNFKGAHKVGRLLYSKLMTEYERYNASKIVIDTVISSAVVIKSEDELKGIEQ